MQDVSNLLSGLPLFRSFSTAQLETLIEKSELKTYAPCETIIKFGQPGKFLGIMVDGEAEAVITEETGKRRLGLNKRGDVIGEMSLLTGEPTTADVIALEKCQLLLIPQDVFSTVLVANHGAMMVLARTLTERLRSRQTDEEAQARVGHAWEITPDPYGLQLSTVKPAKILVLNCGSSSLKYSYFDTARISERLEGEVDRIGLENSRITSSYKKVERCRELGAVGYREAFEAVIDLITSRDLNIIADPNQLTAVGHRVVHGGDKYSSAVVINEDVLRDIRKYSSLAPLHNPPGLMTIEASMKLLPKVPQIAVFDTGFHQKMPPHAFLYGIPYDLYEKDGIRRYGFHGISHNYVALQAAAHLKRKFREMRIITCHLGNGASICAIDHGRSIDTSMGLTPLEGLIMGSRSGDIDPSIVTYLCREKDLSIQEVEDILNRRSGLKGLSGVSSDFRDLEEAANRGNSRAILTIQTFCYRIRKYIGSYIAALGGLDALVFTGGIGGGSAWARGLACQGLSYMGIQVNDILNRTASPRSGEVADISDERSQAKVLVIPTDEARMIARETIRILEYQNVDRVIKGQQERPIPIEVSAHHVHLSRGDIDTIFGVGYELTRQSDLSQPGQYTCAEKVNLVGPRGVVQRVRILGPLRKQSQVEVSKTEEIMLGIKAPIRPSGDLDGSPGIRLEGQKGNCDISEGVICALRHIHMAPEDALSFGLRDGDIVMVKVIGERTLIFGDVLVRVSPDFRLAMHIDTDEANAASIKTGIEGYMIGVQDRK